MRKTNIICVLLRLSFKLDDISWIKLGKVNPWP
mgnify:CR=1 FL=1